ncbi:S-layer homology domain-containing protein [Paenibacillus provencensis]|uniref:S-layer homology domain-containing protein n=1 Tax=Paenibacillus provencensis TaxID=441151 RepID=A0ABW3PUS2_9BACL|nr:S-layer homology domain-containing protein [Paenibacillus sp. MER 78]MCM3127975.1 S-layer homology domain-containing protein [Paenibacillus sp. MER 78]
MMIRWYHRSGQAFLAFLLAVLFVLQPLGSVYAAMSEAPDTAFGRVVDVRKTELAPGAEYTWYDMEIDRGLEKMHFVEFNPDSPQLDLRAGTKGGYVYGMEGVSEMAEHTDAPGNRVIAGINGDFYDLSGYGTGVPNGLFVDQGRILNSGSSSFAFGLKEDGTSVYGKPKLTMSVTIDGTQTNLTSINRYRESNHLTLYTPDFYTSTKTNASGTEVVLQVLEGDVKSGQTMKLKVLEVRANQGDAPLAEGTVVLSASGTKLSIVSSLAAGDELTASFQLDGEWQDASMVISGQGPLVEDRVVQSGVGPEGVHPRTAIGTKADGSIVLFEIDGRAPGFSEGVTTEELANILADIGVVDAMNLDGGGSSTFVARMPGTSDVQMLNRGSDGGERATGNGLLLVNTAPEEAASRLAITPGEERVLAGSSYKFAAAAVDRAGHPADHEGAITWSVSPDLGTISEDGEFIAGQNAAAGQVVASAGGLEGTAEVEIVDQITELQFPDDIKTYNTGVNETLTVTALRDGQVIQLSNDVLEWRVEGNIGTIDDKGVFHSTNEGGQSGTITASYKGIETSMEVNVGVPPVVLEEFESIENYKASGAAYNSVEVDLNTDPDYIRSGDGSIKLSYDFVGKIGTSGAYVSANSKAENIQIPGYPQKIGMWVYGDGQKHWLRAQVRDGNNADFAIDFTGADNGVDWTGWKYVEATVPAGKTTPLTMDLPVRYMETNNNNKTAGAIYIDQIRAIYGPLDEDHEPPVITDLSPAEDTTVTTGTPVIRAHAADAGWDAEVHPGTTLIDPDKIRMYIDGEQVAHTLYPPEGSISYTPQLPLEDGYHTVKLAVRDLSGNQTIKEWNFTVDTGAPKFRYTTPEQVYAGHTYTVNISADQVDQLIGGHLELGFDTAFVKDISVQKGDKLTESQLTHSVDTETGVARLQFSGLESASLTDEDIVAQITYTVKGTASGMNQIAFRSSELDLIDSTEPKSYRGASLKSEIKHELLLQWDENIAQNYVTTYSVTDENGNPVEGAKLFADGAEVGDGTLVTDASGQLRTGQLTEALKSYDVQAIKDQQHSLVSEFTTSALAGTETPYNITVGMGEDPTTSRSFNWHTHPSVNETVVEIAEEAGFAGFDQPGVIRLNGDSKLFNTQDIGTIRVHKANADGLKPGTAYIYRVGDGAEHYSEQGSFTTAPDTGDYTKFLVFGDSQAADLAGFELWGRTMDAANAEHPDAEFMVHVGDMVDNGFKEQEWNWWFSVVQEELMNLTAVTLVGNHEVTGTKKNGDFLAHFNHPLNGTENQKGTNYSFDYKNMHISVLNSEYDIEEQRAWLEADLENTDKQWKLVFFHRGPYASIYDTENVRTAWTPVFDKYNVDLVMNGHDHIYLRTYPLNNQEIVGEREGTTYIIPGSTGPKFYERTVRDFQNVVVDKKIQMYSSVEVDGDTLTVTTKTVDGELVDKAVLENPTHTVEAPTSEIQVGEELQLGVSGMLPEDMEWSVSEPSEEQSEEGLDGLVEVSESGVVKGIKSGEVVIRATSKSSPNRFGDIRLHITESEAPVAIELKGKPWLKPGETDTTVVEAVYASGERMPITEGVLYQSTDPTIAEVDELGVVSALAEGTVQIKAEYAGLTDEYNLQVNEEQVEPELAYIQISGPEQLHVGETSATVTQAVYTDNSLHPLTEGVQYTSSEETVAAIDSEGTITALREGVTVISAVYGEFSNAFTLTVLDEDKPAVQLERIELTGIPLKLELNDTARAVVNGYYSDGTESAVTEGVTFSSSNKNVAGIDANGVIRTHRTGETVITAVYGDESASQALRVEASDPDDDNSDNGSNEDNGNSNGSGEGEASDTPGRLIVSEEDLNALGSEGHIQFSMGNNAFTELVIPGKAAELAEGKTITVQANNVRVAIPSEVLRRFADLASDEQLADSTIVLRAAAANDADVSSWLSQAEDRYAAALQVGAALDLTLSLEPSNGEVITINEFEKPIVISLPVPEGADPALTGIYYGESNGSITYIGGTVRNGWVTAELNHFSFYAAMEYNKSFADLSAGHWAESAVKQLAARQIVEGTTMERFEPNRTVTRAEFAAMLARLLDLEGEAQEDFTDVSSDQWFADEVGLAAKAGIVQGYADGSFAPGQRITRQEMAAMIVRAYTYQAGEKPESGDTGYTDLKASPQWAVQAIKAAHTLGMVTGFSADEFRPLGVGTRAESAQMMYNLANILNQ